MSSVLLLAAGCGGSGSTDSTPEEESTTSTAAAEPLTEQKLEPGQYQIDSPTALHFTVPQVDAGVGYWSGILDSAYEYAGVAWTPEEGQRLPLWGVFFYDVPQQGSAENIVESLLSDPAVEASTPPVNVSLAGTSALQVDFTVISGGETCDVDDPSFTTTRCVLLDALNKPIPVEYEVRLFLIQTADHVRALTIQAPRRQFDSFLPIGEALVDTVAYSGPSEGPDTQDDDDD